MICSGKERFFADLLATRRRRIKSELTQHPFPYVDRLLEKAQIAVWAFSLSGGYSAPSASRSDAIAE